VPSFKLIARLALLGLAALALFSVAAIWMAQSRLAQAITAHADEIYRSPSSPVLGNPDGDVTVVAFLDYNCPYCRQGAPALQKLIESDGKVRLVVKELPVLGAGSEAAARLALASVPQGKYAALHNALMSGRGVATKERTLDTAEDLGIDSHKLEQDAEAPAIQDKIAANKALAASLGVRGVPFYLVGDRVVKEGDDLYARFAAAVADMRETGCQAKC
jgi:protein-disulfide isomerase